ncbi:MAG: helix-turn-helix transcriptional regulator [Stenotrophomonas nitritireducens]|nr:helix-turn-helix transcriptional regulator [Stenotrophomonas nitritireducens]MBN8769672.1 helix-turn-helix transcriptional regulator [Stenotrophomonas sp.]MBN8792216.1 helix-turn-helix transcriptional regulator [Stenotrophomonas nitritireducens]MBN8803096.1 helix-turn-helix transcriptional regulator [Stenotrophomonas acidaminiphila]
MRRPFEVVRRELAGNIRGLRLAEGLSQERLALEAGIDRTYISQIERSVGNPSLLVLCKLADRLGADVETLLAAPDSEEVAKIDR